MSRGLYYKSHSSVDQFFNEVPFHSLIHAWSITVVDPIVPVVITKTESPAINDNHPLLQSIQKFLHVTIHVTCMNLIH